MVIKEVVLHIINICFWIKVGLPSKSGVSGCMLVIVPNVMGICLWSPPLDEVGNSVRGTEFCKELIRGYSFHRYIFFVYVITYVIYTPGCYTNLSCWLPSYNFDQI